MKWPASRWGWVKDEKPTYRHKQIHVYGKRRKRGIVFISENNQELHCNICASEDGTSITKIHMLQKQGSDLNVWKRLDEWSQANSNKVRQPD